MIVHFKEQRLACLTFRWCATFQSPSLPSPRQFPTLAVVRSGLHVYQCGALLSGLHVNRRGALLPLGSLWPPCCFPSTRLHLLFTSYHKLAASILPSEEGSHLWFWKRERRGILIWRNGGGEMRKLSLSGNED